MHYISLDLLDEPISNFKKFNLKPSKIFIGYKAYYHLMQIPAFSNEVLLSSPNPNKRRYQRIKIRVTQNPYEIKVE